MKVSKALCNIITRHCIKYYVYLLLEICCVYTCTRIISQYYRVYAYAYIVPFYLKEEYNKMALYY